MWDLCNLRPAGERNQRNNSISFLSLTYFICNRCATCSLIFRQAPSCCFKGQLLADIDSGILPLQSTWIVGKFTCMGQESALRVSLDQSHQELSPCV